jgi:hypothetical protein
MISEWCRSKPAIVFFRPSHFITRSARLALPLGALLTANHVDRAVYSSLNFVCGKRRGRPLLVRGTITVMVITLGQNRRSEEGAKTNKNKKLFHGHSPAVIFMMFNDYQLWRIDPRQT